MNARETAALAAIHADVRKINRDLDAILAVLEHQAKDAAPKKKARKRTAKKAVTK